jgi:hypothetical protein
MENEKYYKVVRVLHEGPQKFVSAVAARKAMIFYKMGEWARPKDWLQDTKYGNYGILVFDSLEAARDFAQAQMDPAIRIFECEIRNPRSRHLPPTLSLYELDAGLILVLHRRCEWPAGTVMCDQVRLTRLV